MMVQGDDLMIVEISKKNIGERKIYLMNNLKEKKIFEHHLHTVCSCSNRTNNNQTRDGITLLRIFDWNYGKNNSKTET